MFQMRDHSTVQPSSAQIECFLLRLAIHCSQHAGIQIALIERGFATANDGSDDAGKGLTLPMVHTASGWRFAMGRIRGPTWRRRQAHHGALSWA